MTWKASKQASKKAQEAPAKLKKAAPSSAEQHCLEINLA